VALRMLKGGHFVDNKTIDRRYPKSFANLSKVLPLVHKAYIFDNSNQFELIAVKDTKGLEVLRTTAWLDLIIKNNDQLN